jgi:hypothetical protein
MPGWGREARQTSPHQTPTPASAVARSTTLAGRAALRGEDALSGEGEAPDQPRLREAELHACGSAVERRGGAGEGSRTPKPLRASHFECDEYASFSTPATRPSSSGFPDRDAPPPVEYPVEITRGTGLLALVSAQPGRVGRVKVASAA